MGCNTKEESLARNFFDCDSSIFQQNFQVLRYLCCGVDKCNSICSNKFFDQKWIHEQCYIRCMYNFMCLCGFVSTTSKGPETIALSLALSWVFCCEESQKEGNKTDHALFWCGFAAKTASCIKNSADTFYTGIVWVDCWIGLSIHRRYVLFREGRDRSASLVNTILYMRFAYFFSQLYSVGD